MAVHGKSVTPLGLLRAIAGAGRMVGGEVRFDGANLLAMSEDEAIRFVI